MQIGNYINIDDINLFMPGEKIHVCFLKVK